MYHYISVYVSLYVITLYLSIYLDAYPYIERYTYIEKYIHNSHMYIIHTYMHSHTHIQVAVESIKAKNTVNTVPSII